MIEFEPIFTSEHIFDRLKPSLSLSLFHNLANHIKKHNQEVDVESPPDECVKRISKKVFYRLITSALLAHAPYSYLPFFFHLVELGTKFEQQYTGYCTCRQQQSAGNISETHTKRECIHTK